MASHSKAEIHGVSDIVRALQDHLTKHFQPLWIRGEISNFARPASGHCYFSLKDSQAQIRAAMFRRENSKLAFLPEDGLEVIAYGKVAIYQPRGDLQFIVEKMEPAGTGALQIAFEQLKRKLQAEGLFETQRKKPFPEFPRAVGVITSDKGAALHDTLTTLEQRFPALEVIIYPSLVQGKGAPKSLCKMLRIANQRQEVDALLLIRGGGSIEDLQAFNDEAVARAIADSELPVVSGVGHEVDFTIADFVSDYRAPTPTAAAAFISPHQTQINEHLSYKMEQIEDQIYDLLDNLGTELENLKEKIQYSHPRNTINQRNQQIDNMQRQSELALLNLLQTKKHLLERVRNSLTYSSPRQSIDKLRYTLDVFQQYMNNLITVEVDGSKQYIDSLQTKLIAFSPRATLERGYAIVNAKGGRILRSSKGMEEGDRVDIILAEGNLKTEVKKVTHPNKKDL